MIGAFIHSFCPSTAYYHAKLTPDPYRSPIHILDLLYYSLCSDSKEASRSPTVTHHVSIPEHCELGLHQGRGWRCSTTKQGLLVFLPQGPPNLLVMIIAIADSHPSQ